MLIALIAATVIASEQQKIVVCREVRDEIHMTGDHNLAHTIYLRCMERMNND